MLLFYTFSVNMTNSKYVNIIMRATVKVVFCCSIFSYI